SCCVRPSRPAHALAPLLAVLCTAWVAQDYHLSDWPNFRGHFSIVVTGRKEGRLGHAGRECRPVYNMQGDHINQPRVISRRSSGGPAQSRDPSKETRA
ncbi:MAG: hypothetical protein ABIU05_19685, partial [Nitrospirales bacterium]